MNMAFSRLDRLPTFAGRVFHDVVESLRWLGDHAPYAI
jgi:hypothetical protein